VFLCNSTLVILCSPDEGPVTTSLERPQRGMHRFEWDGGAEFHLPHGAWLDLLRANGFEVERLVELYAPDGAGDHVYYDFVGADWARRWPAEELWVATKVTLPGPPTPLPALDRRAADATALPIVLASTSPQRRAILNQLRIPFEVVAPAYDEEPGGDPVVHAAGKARSVDGGDLPVLGIDTIVSCEGIVLGKPVDAGDAERMLELLSGKTHEVISGLCLRTPAWEELHREVTRVTFRELTPRDLAHYLASGEWKHRAGAYAIQGLGANLVERIEGDYLNVVGLPATLLVRVLAERFAGTYGFG
jgi:septum formation protein